MLSGVYWLLLWLSLAPQRASTAISILQRAPPVRARRIRLAVLVQWTWFTHLYCQGFWVSWSTLSFILDSRCKIYKKYVSFGCITQHDSRIRGLFEKVFKHNGFKVDSTEESVLSTLFSTHRFDSIFTIKNCKSWLKTRASKLESSPAVT